jgi:hypothetical protein
MIDDRCWQDASAKQVVNVPNSLKSDVGGALNKDKAMEDRIHFVCAFA